MAAYVKFFDFVEQLGKAIHDLDTAVIKVYLTNATPDQTADTVKADLAEIAGGNGYTAGGTDITNTYTETGGTGSLVSGAGIVTWTAAGGTIGPFRYVVLYNDTAVSDNLIGSWDYGSAVTLQISESFSVDFEANVITIT